MCSNSLGISSKIFVLYHVENRQTNGTRHWVPSKLCDVIVKKNQTQLISFRHGKHYLNSNTKLKKRKSKSVQSAFHTAKQTNPCETTKNDSWEI